jgi:ribosomal-protein-alanine N-acetyltransferase
VTLDRYFAALSSWLDWSASVIDIWMGKPPASVRRASSADAAACADIHAASFAHPWSVLTFEQMLAERGMVAHVAETPAIDGFIIVRAVAGEAEILSVAVRASARKAGLGKKLVEAALDDLVRTRVHSVFLEVEDGNAAALALYTRLGFRQIGRRKGYYRNADGVKDALTMQLALDKRPIPPPVLDV